MRLLSLQRVEADAGRASVTGLDHWRVRSVFGWLILASMFVLPRFLGSGRNVGPAIAVTLVFCGLALGLRYRVDVTPTTVRLSRSWFAFRYSAVDLSLGSTHFEVVELHPEAFEPDPPSDRYCAVLSDEHGGRIRRIGAPDAAEGIATFLTEARARFATGGRPASKADLR